MQGANQVYNLIIHKTLWPHSQSKLDSRVFTFPIRPPVVQAEINTKTAK